jgi:DNA (cytosine-5)-methyltransferase 1
MPKEMKPTVGSLFAGIGGFDLGFTRAGFDVSWQVEIDSWCRKVLAKHFPESERFEDVRTVGKHNLSRVDVIVGGFPCQDISNAGLRAGIGGERSGLWSEMHRIIRELQPHFVLVENVAALLGRGMGRVLGDLAALGYDAEWEVVSAADVGAPHLRERVWILAYPRREGIYERRRDLDAGEKVRYENRTSGNELSRQQQVQGEVLADSPSERCGEARELRHNQSSQWATGGSEDVPHAGVKHGGQGWTGRPSGNCADGQGERKEALAHAGGAGREELDAAAVAERFDTRSSVEGWGEAWWAVEPDVCGMDDGLPQRLDGGLDASSGLGTEGSASEGFERLMRRVWCDLAAGIAPQGRGTDEQLSGELSYALSKVSHETALGHRKEGLENASRYVQRMRQACEAIGVVRNPSEPLLEAWLSLSGEEKDRCHLASCGRTDWAAGEWLGVPRVAHGIPRRVDRLRGLGNAVVPQIPELYAKRIKRLLEATNG